MLKKSISALFIASLSSFPLYANEPVAKGSFDIGPKYEFNIGAVWLKPSASNLNYVINNNELPAQSPRWYEQEIFPSYTAGVELGAKYYFLNGERDIHLEWTHVSTKDSNSINADGVAYFLGPDYEIGPEGIPIRHASGKAEFNYDVINLDAGQKVHFGRDLTLRLFAGLSGALLHEQVTDTYKGDRIDSEFDGPFTMTQEVTANFNGLGPRFGVDADYDVTHGFGVIGEVALSALFGRVHSVTNFTGSAVELEETFDTAVNHQQIKDQHVYQTIPGMDFKLGIRYQHDCRENMTLKLSAGYQGSVYINAISQYLPATLVDGQGIETGGIFVATMDHTLSNYSVQGPFLDFAIQIK